MKITSKGFLIRKLTNEVLRTRGESLRTYFPSFAEHAHENDPLFEDDHLTQIVKKYVKDTCFYVWKRTQNNTQDRSCCRTLQV